MLVQAKNVVRNVAFLTGPHEYCIDGANNKRMLPNE